MANAAATNGIGGPQSTVGQQAYYARLAGAPAIGSPTGGMVTPPPGINSADFLTRLQQQQTAQGNPNAGANGQLPMVGGSPLNSFDQAVRNQQAQTVRDYNASHMGATGGPGFLGGILDALSKAANDGGGLINAISGNAPSADSAFMQQMKQLLGQMGAGGGGGGYAQIGPSTSDIMAILNQITSGGPSSADLQKEAANQVSLSLDPQIQALQNQLNLANSAYHNAYSNEQTTGARQLSDVADTFNRLGAYINAATQQGQQGYQQAQQVQQAGNANLLQGLQQNYQNAANATNAEQARLGQTGVDNSRLSQDSQFLQGLAQNQGTAATNALSRQQANFTGEQNMLGSAQQVAGTQAGTKLQNQIQQALAALTQQNQGDQGTINSQISGLQGQRGAQIQQALAALQQQEVENQQKQEQLALQAIQAGNSGIKSTGGGGSSGLQNLFNDSLALQKYADSQKKGSNNPLTSQNLFSDMLALQNPTNGITDPTKYANMVQLLQQLYGGQTPAALG